VTVEILQGKWTARAGGRKADLPGNSGPIRARLSGVGREMGQGLGSVSPLLGKLQVTLWHPANKTATLCCLSETFGLNPLQRGFGVPLHTEIPGKGVS